MKNKSQKFVLFTFVVSVLWIASFVSVGYSIATMPLLKPYNRYNLLVIIILVTIPTVYAE